MNGNLVILCSLALVTSIAGGCGSAGDDSSPPAPVSPAAFVKSSETICHSITSRYVRRAREVQLRLQAEGQLREENARNEGLAGTWMKVAGIPLLHEVVEEFEALGAPAGDAAVRDRLVGALEKAIAGFEKTPGANPHTPKSPLAEFHRLAGRSGVNSCADL